MYKKIYLLFIMGVLACNIQAQVKTNFNNIEKLSNNSKFNIKYQEVIYQMASPDLSKVYERENAAASDFSKVFYIAEPVPITIDVSKSASWVIDGKLAYAKFTLKAKDAKSLSINFSDFFLPKGTEMFIYNENAEMITGVITDAENNEAKMWGSSIYKGDEINIEVSIPVESKEKASLLITNVAYGYKDIFIDKLSGFGQSGACNINVLCPQGNAWVSERNSVVYIASSNGDALCSGAMLMNTCATNIPYILTANHCFAADGNVAGWRVHFQAWSASCAPNQNSDGVLFNGSSLKANWAQTDFCLVQLNQTPAANSGIHYAGWSRITTGATSGAGIHHPSGDVMKISSYNTPLQRLDNTPWNIGGQNFFAPGTLHWRVQWPTNTGAPNGDPISGVTEGGSSGSPLFDQNRRVVGQLAGGPSACATINAKQDHYGRFDNSWTGGGTNATRLSNWLDPINSGAVTTNTTNVNALYAVVTNPTLSITGANAICNNGVLTTYTLNGLPPGATVLWEATLPNQVVISGCSTCITVNLNKIGTASTATTLKATVTNCSTTHIVTKTVALGSPGGIGIVSYSNMTVCPSDANFRVLSAIQPSVYNFSGNLTVGSTGVSNTLSWSLPSGGSNNGWTWIASGGAVTVSTKQSNTNLTLRATGTNDCGSVFKDYYFSSGPCNISRIAAPGFSILPNPTRAIFTVYTNKGSDAFIKEVLIRNKMGILVKEIKLKGHTKELNININELPSDFYFVQIFDGTTWVSKKIIKE